MIRVLVIVAIIVAGAATQPVLVLAGHPEAVWLWCGIAHLCTGH